MKSFIRNHWPLIIIFVLGLISFGWFSDGLLIAGGDNTIYLNPSFHFKDYFYSWFSFTDAGVPNTIKAIVFPFSFFWYFLNNLNLSLVNIERFWIFLHFVLPGITMYFLIRHLFEANPKKGKIAALVGAFSYMFNYLVMQDVLHLGTKPLLAFLPMLFLFWMKGLGEKKVSFKYSSLFALTSLLYASTNINIAFVAPMYFILFIYFIFFLVITKRFKSGIAFFLLTTCLFLLTNLWWVGDSLISMVRISGNVLKILSSYNFLKNTPIYETFRFMGFWAFRIKNHIPFSPYYYGFPLLISTYLIPVFAFFSLVFKERRNKKVIFAVLAFLGMFLSKGVNFPFGGIYQFLFDKAPFFSMFREPFIKFTIIQVFAVSVLLGFFSEDLYYFLKEKTKFLKIEKRLFLSKFSIGLLLFLILGSYYPILNGSFIQNKDWYQNPIYSFHVKVPDYWTEAGKWFKENVEKESRVLLFPKNYYGQSYNWPSGITVGDPVASFFIANPLIRKPNSSFSSKDRLMELIYKSIEDDPNIDLTPFFNLFSIKYVLQQNDVSFGVDPEVVDPVSMGKILANQKSLRQIKKFGDVNVITIKEKNQSVVNIAALELYKVVEKKESSPIFQAGKVVYINQDVEAFSQVSKFNKSNPNDVFLFSSDIKESSIGEVNYLDEILISLESKKSSTSSSEMAFYDFEVFKKGKYQLLINKCLYPENISKATREIVLEIDGVNLSAKISLNNDWNFMDLGKLAVGHHFVSLTASSQETANLALCKDPLWLMGNNFFDKVTFINNSPLIFKKINPSHYSVNIKKPNSSLLVFNQSFDNNWKIYHNGKELNWKHFMVNGYANAWIIDDNKVNEFEDYNFTIEFAPQKLANLCSIISLLSIFVLLVYVLFNILRKNPKQKINLFLIFIYFSFVLIQFLDLNIEKDWVVFMIFVLWLFMSFLNKSLNKISLYLSIIFLLLCPTFLILNQVISAKQAAILSFIYLLFVIMQQLVSLITRQTSDKNDKI